jgi:hypothetical protein
MSETSKSDNPYVEIVFNPNEQVAEDARQIDGAFRIIPRGFEGGQGPRERLYKCLLADGTGSMLEGANGAVVRSGHKRDDCHAAGVFALNNSIGPDDYFSLISFNKTATRIFPEHGRPVLGTPVNIQAALRAWNSLGAEGNTFISTGIEQALADFLSLDDVDEGSIALITDGFNNAKDSKALRAVLGKIKEFRQHGHILKVQPIAVGHEVSMEQLDLIRTECVSDPIQHIQLNAAKTVWGEALTRIFNDLSSKKLRAVEICFVDKPSTTELLSFSQQRPSVLDLTDQAKLSADEQSISITIGGWEVTKSRLYSFSLGVEKPVTRDNREAAGLQIKYTVGRRTYTLDPLPIKVRWTKVVSLSGRVPAELAEANGITGAVEAVGMAIQAQQNGDKAAAQKFYQTAHDLAKQACSFNFIRDLGNYVDIDEEGRVTLKALTAEDALSLKALSYRQEDTPAE